MGNKIERVKKHFGDNKKIYIAGTVGVTIGIAVTVMCTRSISATDEANQIVQVVKQIAFRAEANPVIINLVERSTASKPVHLVGSNLYFDSLSDAARKTGHSISALSKHINGKTPHLKGDIFELLTPA